MSKVKKQKLPKWFNGTVYDEGAVVTNMFSGAEYELNNIELSMYDFIMGSQMVFEMLYKMRKFPSTTQLEEFHNGLNWFRVNNPDAYYVLLD